jgi:hypothetical protein
MEEASVAPDEETPDEETPMGGGAGGAGAWREVPIARARHR